MPAMKSPYVGKPIDVSEEQVGDFEAAGFALVEPVKKKPAVRGKGK